MAERRPETPKFRVLVVEDEPLIAMDIEDMLESLGCTTVGPVAQLADAMHLATDATIDCAILDVNVRGGRTYAVASLLRERGTPVLLTSGYAQSALPAELEGLPRLTKPYSSDQLERGIGKLFERLTECER